jgi:hypothetical protein
MKLEDLKVGQYVRFKDKRGIIYIRKIVEIPEDNRYASLYLDKEANYSRGLSPKNIIKEPSFNVIDILEEGDIISFYEDIDNYKKQYVIGIPDLITLDNIKDKITNDNIRLVSILTEEEMEQRAYKVEE